jgi:hypothetical protein
LKKIFYILLILAGFFLTSVPTAVEASHPVAIDCDEKIDSRSFDASKLQELKQNPDYQYDRAKQEEKKTSIIDKILYRIVRFLVDVLANPSGNVGNIFFYTACGLLVAVLIFIILRMNAINLFSSNKKLKNSLEIDELLEDIHEINYTTAIQEAVRQKLYRRATRLYYMQALKTLSDKKLIQWEIDKTNHEYLYELKEPRLANGFENITYAYEYVWYGNVEIEEKTFEIIQSNFNQFFTLTATAR